MVPPKPFDSKFVEENFEKYELQLHRYLTGLLADSHLASDALQITFTKLFQNPPKEDTNIRAWLFRVAYNQAMEMRRRQKIDRRALDKISGDLDFENEDDEIRRDAQDPEQIERIRQAILRLTPGQQEVVRLRVYEDLKFVEIAEKLTLPLGTVLTRMRAATQKLSQYLRTPE